MEHEEVHNTNRVFACRINKRILSRIYRGLKWWGVGAYEGFKKERLPQFCAWS